MRRSSIAILAALPALLATGPGPAAAQPRPMHAIAMHGEPKYGPDFKHFDYVNPDAPKGGDHPAWARRGTFDSFNPFIPQGQPPRRGASAETLLIDRSRGRAVHRVRADRRQHRVAGRPLLGRSSPCGREARWHDGKPITVEDVIWSLQHPERARAIPFYRFYYASVARREKVGERTGQVHLQPDRQPRAAADRRASCRSCRSTTGKTATSTQTTLEPPLGSGPYRIDDVRARPLRRLRARRRTTGARTCRSTGDRTTSIGSATTTTATTPSSARRSRPAASTSASRTRPRPGRWTTTSPAVRDGLADQGGASDTTARPACRPSSSTPAGRSSRTARVRAGAGLRLRLRVDQQEPVLRPVHAHRELLRQLRAGRERPARARRSWRSWSPTAAGSPTRSSPRSTSRRSTDGSGWPRENLRKAFALLERGRLGGARHEARQRQDRRAAALRDPADAARPSSASCCPSRAT